MDKLIESTKDDLRKSFNKMQQGQEGMKVIGVKRLDGLPYKRMKLTRPEFAETFATGNECSDLGTLRTDSVLAGDVISEVRAMMPFSKRTY